MPPELRRPYGRHTLWLMVHPIARALLFAPRTFGWTPNARCEHCGFPMTRREAERERYRCPRCCCASVEDITPQAPRAKCVGRWKIRLTRARV